MSLHLCYFPVSTRYIHKQNAFHYHIHNLKPEYSEAHLIIQELIIQLALTKPFISLYFLLFLFSSFAISLFFTFLLMSISPKNERLSGEITLKSVGYLLKNLSLRKWPLPTRMEAVCSSYSHFNSQRQFRAESTTKQNRFYYPYFHRVITRQCISVVIILLLSKETKTKELTNSISKERGLRSFGALIRW